MRVVIVAAPLSSRSGVYRSTIDLVRAARSRGLAWRALVGVRPGAGGTPSSETGIVERTFRRRGRHVIGEIRQHARTLLGDAEVVISMVPQSDVALRRDRGAGGPARVAWVRGRPWPAPGEQNAWRRASIALVERRALLRADAVWTTSPLLRDEIHHVLATTVVPAGVPLLERLHDGAQAGRLVFAGRLSVEKNVDLFLEVVRRTGSAARVHGEGPLLGEAVALGTPGVQWRGWTTPDEIWAEPGVLLCPSFREAFGRSAVEAASTGIPVILSEHTGVAPLLYRDPELARRFVLPVGDPGAWAAAVSSLEHDAALRRQVSNHLVHNARGLSIEASLDAALSALRTFERTP